MRFFHPSGNVIDCFLGHMRRRSVLIESALADTRSIEMIQRGIVLYSCGSGSAGIFPELVILHRDLIIPFTLENQGRFLSLEA